MPIDLKEMVSYLQVADKSGARKIFDPVRKKWVVFTPEELVRQTAIHYLIEIKGYSKRLMSVERALTYNTMTRRYDLVIFSQKGHPIILVECKSPDIKIDQSAIDQASIYNEQLTVDHIWITNGYNHYIYRIDNESRLVSQVDDVPAFHISEEK